MEVVIGIRIKIVMHDDAEIRRGARGPCRFDLSVQYARVNRTLSQQLALPCEETAVIGTYLPTFHLLLKRKRRGMCGVQNVEYPTFEFFDTCRGKSCE